MVAAMREEDLKKSNEKALEGLFPAKGEGLTTGEPEPPPCAHLHMERGPSQAPCLKEGNYESTMFRWDPEESLEKPHKPVVQHVCKIHYMEMDLSIYVFRCSETCEEAARKRAIWHIDDEDLWTYVPMTMVTNEHEVRKVDEEHSIVDAAFTVKCAYCGKDLNPEIRGLRAVTF